MNITLHSRFECLQTCSVLCYVISYFYSIGCRIENLLTAIGCVHIAESVGSRRELVANSCTHRRRRRDATKQFRRVGGVYWAYHVSVATSTATKISDKPKTNYLHNPYRNLHQYRTVLLATPRSSCLF